MKALADRIEELGTTADELAAATGLDVKLIKSIATGNYTPSPSQRQRIAAALDIDVSEIAWGHTVPVQHLRGNGPQTGRAT